MLLADEGGQRGEAPERQRVRLSERGERVGAVSLQGVPDDGQEKLPLPLQVNVVVMVDTVPIG